MNTGIDKIIRDFLNFLEEKETRLLNWGCVEGGFSGEEIEELLEKFLDERGETVDSQDFLQEMVNRRLLFVLDYDERLWWRTRMAESIRLFANLRQIFPKQPWRLASTLVSDFRFNLQTRAYPTRDIVPDDVMKRLADLNLTTMERQYVRQIIAPQGVNTMCLSEFQVIAAYRMFKDLKLNKSRGMIVSAGTGTGKTLAFYLPAFSFVGSIIEKDSFWTKVVAIYPRNELLKDQFSEAYREARKLDSLLLSNGRRKITIGAFFGPTPQSSNWIASKWFADKRGKGFVCPYLRCPQCGGDMIWLASDKDSGKEWLHCIQPRCDGFAGEDEIILTRDKMVQTPPDILFTTTESLSRQMVDNRYGKIFGMGVAKSPKIVLLDEVHTYSGVHGAQVAYLLRRWRHKARLRAHFTGLSATLEEAGEFFAQLTGLSPSDVLEINPGEELIKEGMEYQLILRGDPVSATSLLSTTIQAVMLLRRILDPRGEPVSSGFYGSRVFTFTDDLDVTNRLFHDLLDAEGLDSWNRRIKDPLAALRSRNLPENRDRLVEGQSWHLCEEIGHPENLRDSLRIGRTSSQDSGVDEASDIVVATASLEVGFNDPSVGAVLQHKAPLNMASYLQRKGRAGRNRSMRPWMVVVLSDYGRDRIAYQSYEMLFNPRLPRRKLPVGNRYVQRMQAVYAFLDWLAELKPLKHIPGSLWNDLSAPADQVYNKDYSNYDYCRQRQEKVVEFLRSFLRDYDLSKEVQEYLSRSLQLGNDVVQSLLWVPPRSLLLNLMPVLLRRLESDWQQWPAQPGSGGVQKEHFIPYEPLPEFIPPNLFSDLQLPEVSIVTPPSTKGGDPERHTSPVVQALNTFSPGRITRRFGVAHRYVRHWIPVSLEKRQTLEVDEICSRFYLTGLVKYKKDNSFITLPCYRPVEMSPEVPPKEINISSNSWPVWGTQIVARGRGFGLSVPVASTWEGLITEMRFYVHTQNDSVEVRRFTIGAHALIRLNTGEEVETTIDYIAGESGEDACLGFIHNVDGMVFFCRVPENFRIRGDDPNNSKVYAFRTALFRYRFLSTPKLNGLANRFQRDWLCQIFLSALTTRALQQQKTLEESCGDLFTEDFPQEMDEVMETIFQTIEVETVDDNEDPDHYRQRVHDKLRELFEHNVVRDTLGEIVKTLWEEPDCSWQEWARERFRATLGCALLQACLQLTPEVESGDLLLDTDPGPPDDKDAFPDGIETIWITEGTSGGAGVIEEVLRRYSEDPRRFFRMVESALEPGDFELVNFELTRLLNLASKDLTVSGALEQVRGSASHKELTKNIEDMMKLLSQKGLMLTHPVISAINARILRPGSSRSTDILLQQVINKWNKEETRLGVEIDPRVFAYISSRDDGYLPFLEQIQGGETSNQQWCFQVFYSLLWPRGNLVRSQALAVYNPFTVLPDTDRELVRDVIYHDKVEIMLGEENWKEKLCGALAKNGNVLLTTDLENMRELRSAVVEMAVTPVETGFLMLYSRVSGCRRERNKISVTFDLREVVQ